MTDKAAELKAQAPKGTERKYLGPMNGQPISKIAIHKNRNLDFLVRLRQLDILYVTPRDVLALAAIIGAPGISMTDLCNTVGVPNVSLIRSNINRLIRWGYVEDRRKPEKVNHGVPYNLHPLPAGIAFWNTIRPED